MDLRHFESAEEFRRWLTDHAGTASKVVLALYKRRSGRSGITYRQALDEALCFGWIDGVRRGLDPDRYTVRFTPRRRRSVWSRINIRRFEELQAQGRVTPAGLRAFRARRAELSGVYSFENRHRPLAPDYQARFEANHAAWTFFQARPTWYRKTASWWVMSAKKEDTRQRRLGILIEDSAAARTIRPLTRPSDRRPTGPAG